MSDNDLKLIEKARAIHYAEWYSIDALIEKAESMEAKSQLESIEISKYHREEYSAGLL